MLNSPTLMRLKLYSENWERLHEDKTEDNQ